MLGTGQGDMRCPFTWIAVFDVLLWCLLNQDVASRENVYPPKPDDRLYRARDVYYAVDLQWVACTLRALQHKADLVSVFAQFFNMQISTNKLRVFHICWIAQPLPPELVVASSRC